MLRSLTSVMLVAGLVFCLAGCGKGGAVTQPSNTSVANKQAVPNDDVAGKLPDNQTLRRK